MDGTRQSIGRGARFGLLRRPSAAAAVAMALSSSGLFTRLSGGMLVGELVAAAAAMAPDPAVAGDQSEGSGLPLPRFASLKSDHVNVRGGPNKDHDVAWIYTRPALPVEITAEFENWRKIRDRDGSEGWVYHTLLSGKRTAFVAQPRTQPPRNQSTSAQPTAAQLTNTQSVRAQVDLAPLHAAADGASALRAMLEPGVLGMVKRCNGQWCRLTGTGFDGWVEQSRLWGVYPNEKIE
jgi:SH3-like domain-containing protein